MSLAVARAGAAGQMPRKRSEAEGREGNGEVGGRLAWGAEVSLAQSGQDQSADAGRCHGSRERSLCHPFLQPSGERGTPCQLRGIFDRGGGGGIVCALKL